MTDEFKAVLITLDYENIDLNWEEFNDIDKAKQAQKEEEEYKTILVIGDIEDIVIDT